MDELETRGIIGPQEGKQAAPDLPAQVKLRRIESQLQNSIWTKTALLPQDSDFSQIAYALQDMSICEKPNQDQNHQFLPAKQILQLALDITFPH